MATPNKVKKVTNKNPAEYEHPLRERAEDCCSSCVLATGGSIVRKLGKASLNSKVAKINSKCTHIV